ncbi:MAG: hypothetical protein Q8R02_19035 [Hyphomonadaceae bacterium]|nr:hypothetical protein [Hyphomonadaceae bacterium]
MADADTLSWARDLRLQLLTEIGLMESGVKEVFHMTYQGRRNVTEGTLAEVRVRLAQIERLIAAFEQNSPG